MVNLDAQITRLTHNRHIRPTLSFHVGFRGDNNNHLKFGQVILSIGGASGDMVSLTSQAVSLDVNLHQRSEKTEALQIELSDRDLERIEEIRGGSDLRCQLNGEFHIFNSRNNEFDTATFTTSYRVPRSDWAEVLTEFEYGNIQIIELHFPNTPAKEHFEKAWKHIEDGDDQFAHGDWGETLTHCRKAIEVIDNLEKAEDVDDLIGEEKWERMGRLKGDLSSYLSLGPHSEEGIGHEPIERRDAQASLLISKAIVNYVADALRERDR